MPQQDPQLGQAGTVTLATVSGVVTGSISLGPQVDSRDPHAVWYVDTILWKTNRPGQGPNIPRIEVYLDDEANFANAQFLDYDGSFGNARGSCRVTRGQKLRAIWYGGNVGDIAQFSVTGTKAKA
jgi:hypothetical protein